jgi:hypothetical protein
MWHEVIKLVNLDGMFKCIKCNKDLENAKEGIDFEYQDINRNKICLECLGTEN